MDIFLIVFASFPLLSLMVILLLFALIPLYSLRYGLRLKPNRAFRRFVEQQPNYKLLSSSYGATKVCYQKGDFLLQARFFPAIRIELCSQLHPPLHESLCIHLATHPPLRENWSQHIADPTPSHDQTLDQLLTIRGNPLIVAALLDKVTRHQLCKMFLETPDLYVTQGKVVWFASSPISAFPMHQHEQLIDVMSHCFQLLHQQQGDSNICDALLTIAKRDPLPAVRAHCLSVLRTYFCEDSTTHEAIQEAQKDGDPSVALLATLYAQMPYSQVLLLVESPKLIPEIHIQALQYLEATQCPPSLLCPVLNRLETAPNALLRKESRRILQRYRKQTKQLQKSESGKLSLPSPAPGPQGALSYTPQGQLALSAPTEKSTSS